jgi:hypothetical protein
MKLWEAGENCIMKSSIICTVHHDQNKEDKMGEACNTHGEMRTAYKILVGKPKGKRLLISIPAI